MIAILVKYIHKTKTLHKTIVYFLITKTLYTVSNVLNKFDGKWNWKTPVISLECTEGFAMDEEFL